MALGQLSDDGHSLPDRNCCRYRCRLRGCRVRCRPGRRWRRDHCRCSAGCGGCRGRGWPGRHWAQRQHRLSAAPSQCHPGPSARLRRQRRLQRHGPGMNGGSTFGWFPWIFPLPCRNAGLSGVWRISQLLQWHSLGALRGGAPQKGSAETRGLGRRGRPSPPLLVRTPMAQGTIRPPLRRHRELMSKRCRPRAWVNGSCGE